VGFDVIPTDFIAAVLKKALPDAWRARPSMRDISSAISCAPPVGRSGGRAASAASARRGQEATVDQIVEAPIAG